MSRTTNASWRDESKLQSAQPLLHTHAHTRLCVCFLDEKKKSACVYGTRVSPPHPFHNTRQSTRQEKRRYNISNDEALSSSSVAAGNSPPVVMALYKSYWIFFFFYIPIMLTAIFPPFPSTKLSTRFCAIFSIKIIAWWDGRKKRNKKLKAWVVMDIGGLNIFLVCVFLSLFF